MRCQPCVGSSARINVQVRSKTRLITYIFGFEGIVKLSSDKSTTSFKLTINYMMHSATASAHWPLMPHWLLFNPFASDFPTWTFFFYICLCVFHTKILCIVRNAVPLNMVDSIKGSHRRNVNTHPHSHWRLLRHQVFSSRKSTSLFASLRSVIIN